jgi:hypothetical protein
MYLACSGFVDLLKLSLETIANCSSNETSCFAYENDFAGLIPMHPVATLYPDCLNE